MLRGAGSFRDFLYIRTPAETTDSEGEIVDTLSVGTGRACSIEPIMGGEQFAAQRENNSTILRIRFRYEPNLITEKDILEDRSTSPYTQYDVEAVLNPSSKNRELVCNCVLRT